MVQNFLFALHKYTKFNIVPSQIETSTAMGRYSCYTFVWKFVHLIKVHDKQAIEFFESSNILQGR